MKKHVLTLFVLLLLAAVCFADATVRVLPHRWSMNTHGKGRVKAEILNIDPSSVDASSIFMNGVAATRTRKTDKKTIAFFHKSDILATLGTLQPGQVVTISVTFGSTNGPASLSDDVKIVKGKKSGKAPTTTPTPGKP
jgi:hypothetical protein